MVVTDTTAVEEALEKGLSFFERVTKFQWCLALLSGTLFLDIALHHYDGSNILSFEWGQAAGVRLIGPTIVAVAAYSFFMAVVSPTSKFLFDAVIRFLAEVTHVNRFFSARGRPSDEHVLVSRLREKADAERDPILDARLHRHERAVARMRDQQTAIAASSYACFLLIIVDQVTSCRSLVNLVLHLAAETSPVALAAALGSVMIISSPWLIDLFDYSSSSYYIWSPYWAKKLAPPRRPPYQV